MSLTVPAGLLEAAGRGQVTDAEFAATVRESLPYAWQVVSAVAADLHEGGRESAEHGTPPPSEAERGQLLRAMASDAIRGVLERYFAVRLAFQNCHKVGAFLPEAGDSAAYREFVSPRAQLLNQSPAQRDC